MFKELPMKRALCAVLVLLFSVSSASAQTLKQAQQAYNTAGPVWATVKDGQATNDDNYSGANDGADYQLTVFNNLSGMMTKADFDAATALAATIVTQQATLAGEYSATVDDYNATASDFTDAGNYLGAGNYAASIASSNLVINVDGQNWIADTVSFNTAYNDLNSSVADLAAINSKY
jgi:hypothetical protein